MSEQACRLGQVEIALRRQAAASSRFDHEVGARAGLHLSTCEANFVNLLLLHGPLSPGELGRLSGTGSSGTITGVIDRLERAGYVRRSRCVVDRRKVEVELDLERLAEANADRSRLLASVAAGYTADQLALIADFLHRLADAESSALTPAETAAS